MVNDPVADFIIQIKNAGAVRKTEVCLPYSKLKHAIAEKLITEGYLKDAQKRGKKVKKTLEVTLAYDENGTHRVRGVERISKPGRRMYTGADDIFPVKYGTGKLILSTEKGILTGEEAKKEHVGGEQLFRIW